MKLPFEHNFFLLMYRTMELINISIFPQENPRHKASTPHDDLSECAKKGSAGDYN